MNRFKLQRMLIEPVRPLVLVCLLSLCLAACDRQGYSAALTEREQEAVERFERDRWTDVIEVYRTGTNTLRVRTRQGNETIDYWVTLSQEGEAEFVRLPIVTFGDS